MQTRCSAHVQSTSGASVARTTSAQAAACCRWASETSGAAGFFLGLGWADLGWVLRPNCHWPAMEEESAEGSWKRDASSPISWRMNPSLGETGRRADTSWKAAPSDMRWCCISHARHTDTERLRPITQCTSTRTEVDSPSGSSGCGCSYSLCATASRRNSAAAGRCACSGSSSTSSSGRSQCGSEVSEGHSRHAQLSRCVMPVSSSSSALCASLPLPMYRYPAMWLIPHVIFLALFCIFRLFELDTFLSIGEDVGDKDDMKNITIEREKKRERIRDGSRLIE